MEMLGDLIKIVIPSALVMYAGYLVFRHFLKVEKLKGETSLKEKSRELAFPLRLQAYERVILFLERITLPNFLARIDKKGMSAPMLYQQLLLEIRDEYNHNLSQQIYMSDKAWNLATNCKERTIALVNQVFSSIDSKAEATIFAKAIMDKILSENLDICGEAIEFIKNEIRELY